MGELPPIWGRYGCLKIWKFLDGCMGHATWQWECITLTGKVLSAWVLVNKVTHMHTYIIPCKPTPITLSVFVWWYVVCWFMYLQVTLNKYHTVFLTDAGKVYTCGHGLGGRLGHGDEQTRLVCIVHYCICDSTNYFPFLCECYWLASVFLEQLLKLGYCSLTRHACLPACVFCLCFLCFYRATLC